MKIFNCDQILRTSDTGTARSGVCKVAESNMADNSIVKFILITLLPLYSLQIFNRKQPVLSYVQSDRLMQLQGKKYRN